MSQNAMKPIGGYFELELRQGETMYDGLVALNSARNALVYLIKASHIQTIYMPCYNCHAVVDAVRRFCPETQVQYYHVDSGFRPLVDGIPTDAWLYYVNYYGLQDHILRELDRDHVIVDNAQAFYSQGVSNGHTVYCPRKFFGVCDGGYLRTGVVLDQLLECDTSFDRAIYLLKRIDCGASAAYGDFRSSDAALAGRPLMQMSHLTRRVLSGIDYEAARMRRRDNFEVLNQALGNRNSLSPSIDTVSKLKSYVPLCYPFMTEGAEALRQCLIDHLVFVPTYWPELKASGELNEYEHNFVNQIVCLPLDQRYGRSEMERIIQIVRDRSCGTE